MRKCVTNPVHSPKQNYPSNSIQRFLIDMTFLSNDLSHVTVTAVLPALLTSMGAAVAALGTLEGYEPPNHCSTLF